MLALCIILAALLIVLLFSRIHFHFRFTLQVRRESGSRRERPTPRSTSGLSVATRLDDKRGGVMPGEAASPRLVQDPSVSRALEAARESCEADLASALMNLGVKGQKAKEVAKKAIMEGGQDFDSRLKWALRNAA